MDLAPLLRAHGFLRVERPPLLWEADCDDEPLVRLLGESISAALVRGTELADVILRANNVTVEGDGEGRTPLPGDYVALTVIGAGDWRPEVIWDPDVLPATVLLNDDLDRAARVLGVPWAYTRSDGEGGSVTFFVSRLVDG
jgi:hypothetical protein